MKVALVTNFPFYSGTGKVTYKTWEIFKSQAKFEADLFLTHFLKEADRHFVENQDVRTLQPFNYSLSPFLSRLMLYYVDPFLLPRGYDLYHLGNQMIARFARFRKPSVVTVHDVLQFLYPERFANFWISKIYNHFMEESVKSLICADQIICVSQWSRQELLKYFNEMDHEKVSVIYNGLDHKTFYPRSKRESRQRLGWPQNKLIILSVGSEIERKQIPLVIKAFALLKEKFPDSILVRHGEKKDSTKALIRNLGLENEIIYKFYSPEAELPFVYSGADVLLQVSSEEGFCFPVVEAMACGLPVVASGRASLPEVCGGSAAAEVGRLEAAEVVESVSRVLSLGQAELESVRAGGLANARRFSWEKNASETLGVYQRVLAGFPKGQPLF